MLLLDCDDDLKVRWLSNQIFVGYPSGAIWATASKHSFTVPEALRALLPVGYEWEFRYTAARGFEYYNRSAGWRQYDILAGLRRLAMYYDNKALVEDLDSDDWRPLLIHMLTGSEAQPSSCSACLVSTCLLSILSVAAMAVAIGLAG